MNWKRNDWTPERLELAIRLWTVEGLSVSAIAAILGGCTRNAVIGKLHRLGLKKGMPAGVLKEAARLAKPNRRRGERVPLQKFHAWTPPPEPDLPIVPGPVRFLDRRMDRQCASIIDDAVPIEARMCCGEPIKSGSYCAEHLRLYCNG